MRRIQKSEHFRPFSSFVSLQPPFVPNNQSIPGQPPGDFLSRIGAHTDGYVIYPGTSTFRVSELQNARGETKLSPGPSPPTFVARRSFQTFPHFPSSPPFGTKLGIIPAEARLFPRFEIVFRDACADRMLQKIDSVIGK